MSSFMGAAWLDLARGGDVAAVLADLRTGAPSDEPAELMAWTAGSRIELCSDGVGYGSLGDLVAGVLGRTAAVARAVVLLDHDEYGSEHIVLTCDGVGTVRRVHHVYVDPEGEPSLTDVPPMPGVGPGRGRGALLDDAAARAMLGDLFGVPAKTMPKRAEQAHDWLDALGVAWVGAAGGAPVNLRPGPVWRDTVAQDVVPRLPGRWLPRDYDLVRLPASPVTCLIVRARAYSHAVIYPMYVPDQYGILRFHVPVHSAPAAAVPLLDELTGKALPFFDRYGHPEGLRELCRERIDREPADRVDPHDLRCLAATEVILGRYDEASRTYARLATTATRSSPPWAKDLAEEGRVRSLLLRHEPAVVHEALTEMIDRQLAHLGLPLDRE